MDKIKRYLIFIIGLFLNSVGVAIVTRANMGTSPISSIPYVLSLNFPQMTMGVYTIFLSMLFVVLQLIILRKNFVPINALQVPVSFIFGEFIDICMEWYSFIDPQHYYMKIIYLVIGCVIIGWGVYMEVLADVIMLPGEAFVRSVVQTFKTEFGVTKICFDASLAITAGIISLVCVHTLNGVREGTVIAVILVGFVARQMNKRLAFLPAKIYKDVKPTEKEELVEPEEPVCILIGRQYGSGGHEIGKRLAEKLSYNFYDRELIEMAAETTGYSKEFVSKKEESITNSFLFDFVNNMYSYAKDFNVREDKIFNAESESIKELVKKGNCVIVGRCADYVLRDKKNIFKIFLSSPIESRIKRIMETENKDEKEAHKRIQLIEKYRAEYYHHYTNKVWGMSSNYDLCLNTSIGFEKSEKIIMEILNEYGI